MANAIEAIQGVAEKNGSAGSPFGTVNVGDINQFYAAIKGSEGIIGDATQPVGSTKKKENVNILNKLIAPLSEFRQHFDAIADNIANIVSNGSMYISEMFQVQYQLTQMAYMNDLSSKSADKLSQAAQTLFRNQ
ncbi:MAG: hypothetical protein LBG86_02215 [Puniceicoccales bacterium]|jgi:uncharacterized protein YeaO (DUF488 family)|nr:hypothetical protein [Puniceicoccales bacterium]